LYLSCHHWQKHFTFAQYDGYPDKLIEELIIPALLGASNLRTVTTSHTAVTPASNHKQLLRNSSLQHLILQAPRNARWPLRNVPKQLRHLVRLDTDSCGATSFPPPVPPVAPENPVWLPMLASTPEERVKIWTKIIRFAGEPRVSSDDSWQCCTWWKPAPSTTTSFYMDIERATIGACYSVSRDFNVGPPPSIFSCCFLKLTRSRLRPRGSL